MSSADSGETAEQRFRLAFERLKVNKPLRLGVGTSVSQNNVAREAGCDPSALRKSRFPSLVREVQAYVDVHLAEAASESQIKAGQRKARMDLKERLDEIKSQRDHAQSQLVSAHRRIVELLNENDRLKRRLDEVLPPPVTL